jgi:hypothetical protein
MDKTVALENHIQKLNNIFGVTELFVITKEIDAFVNDSNIMNKVLTLPSTVNFSIESIIQNNIIQDLYNTIGNLSYKYELAIKIEKRYKEYMNSVIGAIKIANNSKTLSEAESLIVQYIDNDLYIAIIDHKSNLEILQNRYKTVSLQYEMVSRLITAYEKRYGINPDRMPDLR